MGPRKCPHTAEVARAEMCERLRFFPMPSSRWLSRRRFAACQNWRLVSLQSGPPSALALISWHHWFPGVACILLKFCRFHRSDKGPQRSYGKAAMAHRRRMCVLQSGPGLAASGGFLSHCATAERESGHRRCQDVDVAVGCDLCADQVHYSSVFVGTRLSGKLPEEAQSRAMSSWQQRRAHIWLELPVCSRGPVSFMKRTQEKAFLDLATVQ